MARERPGHHWHRLVKDIGGKPKYLGWGKKVVKPDESIGVSQLLGGARAPVAPPKSMPKLTSRFEKLKILTLHTVLMTAVRLLVLRSGPLAQPKEATFSLLLLLLLFF